MTFATELHHRRKVAEFSERHRLGLLTLLFTDMIGSTDMKQRLGDIAAVNLMRLHHALLREALAEFREAEEIGVAGDSFFIAFTRPSDAVKFALLLQSRLRTFNQTSSEPLRDRVGIHIGEVVIEEKDGALDDLYGIQVDTCSRVMSLADAEQILLTRSAFDNARQVLKGVEMPNLKALSWLNHGPYRLKGVEEPLEICEVGETPFAALVPPKDSEKAHRHISADSEPVLGWRPSIGQQVPNTRWVLDRQLGEGGFGEVWLAHHESLNEERVFKFCFRADRVRSLKRELTLFKILKERVGHHPNIVGIQDVFLETPPFYLIMDFEEAKDLRAWSLANGGANSISLADRLEIIAQVCEAVSAAHNAGILHRDIKPSNILVSRDHEGRIKARLMDFGIGQVLAEEAISAIRREGFTETVLGTSSAQTGSQLYMAPELLVGQPATKQSDIYSIGVVLFQLIVGDFQRPLTTDWQDDIHDPVLRDDLGRCFTRKAQGKFASVDEFRKDLRSYRERKKQFEADQMRKEKAELDTKNRRALRGVLALAFVVALVLSLGVYAWNQSVVIETQRLLTARERDGSISLRRQTDNLVRQIVFNNLEPDELKLKGLKIVPARNPELQAIVESELQRASQDTNVVSSLGIVLRPSNGNILALANHPKLIGAVLNPAVSSSVEPGNLIGFALIGSALEKRFASLDTAINCENGSMKVEGMVLRDMQPYGTLTMEQVLWKQSLIGAFKVSQMLGKQGLYDSLRQFGFGHPAGIQMAGEAPGFVIHPARWEKATELYLAQGKGLEATPIQLAMAMGAVVYGGKLMAPRLVLEVRDAENREILSYRPEVVSQPLSSKNANLMRVALAEVVSTNGVGHFARVPGITVGGTHSTVWSSGPSKFNYYSFLGFFPAESPEFVCFIRLDSRLSGLWANEVVAPIFVRVADKIAEAEKIQRHGLSQELAIKRMRADSSYMR